jgi:hypothetical protein
MDETPMPLSRLPKLFLAAFAMAATGAAFAHLLRPAWVAGLSTWPLAAGWQREIAVLAGFASVRFADAPAAQRADERR